VRRLFPKLTWSILDFFMPHNASSAPWSSTPWLHRSISLAVQNNGFNASLSVGLWQVRGRPRGDGLPRAFSRGAHRPQSGDRLRRRAGLRLSNQRICCSPIHPSVTTSNSTAHNDGQGQEPPPRLPPPALSHRTPSPLLPIHCPGNTRHTLGGRTAFPLSLPLP
jgi:hypothetical protein